MSLKLVIGNKNYSSWSLRPWLHLKHAGVAFEEIMVQLYRPGHREDLLHYSPTGKVPTLIDGELHIWDSLAICEYIAEKTGCGWPKAAAARAHARSLCAEMHSGFTALRSQCPMNARARKRVPITPELGEDVARIDAMWSSCRERHGAAGNHLFGAFSIADAMYAPVVLRFATYGLPLSASSAAYQQTMLTDRYVSEWLKSAREETWTVTDTDAIGTSA